MSEFGEALARYRIEAGLNQRQLGAAIGLDSTQVNKIERGHRPALGAKYMMPLVRALRLNQTQAKDLVQLAGHSPKVLEFQAKIQTPVYPTILRKKGKQPDVYGRQMPELRRRRSGALASPPIEEPPLVSDSAESTTVGQDIDKELEGISQEECDIVREFLVLQARQLKRLIRSCRGE
jgi:transcriptional regulator with XRE-family HTH domain